MNLPTLRVPGVGPGLFLLASVLLAWPSILPAQSPATQAAVPAKKAVNTSADLPTFTYAVPGNLADLLTADASWTPFATALRANLEDVLRDYAIGDRKTRQSIQSDLLLLDLDQNRMADAQARLTEVVELEDKPEAKAFDFVPFLAAAILQARRASGAQDGPAYRAALATAFAQQLGRVPASASASVAKMRGGYELMPPELALTAVNAQLAPLAKQNGNRLSGEEARQLLMLRSLHRWFLPAKAEALPALAAHLAAHPPLAVDIWAEREVVLDAAPARTPVTVAIWDTGVDAGQFPGRLYVNPAERDNGRDNDGNGFVADLHGIAFDGAFRRTAGMLMPVEEVDRAQFPRLVEENRTVRELRAGIENAQTQALKARFQAMTPAQLAEESRLGSLFDDYAHGTKVAAVAVAGNPFARILNARMTWDTRRSGPPTMVYDDAWARAFAASIRDSVAYFKAHGVRVVNMSWTSTPAEIADNLRRAGVAKDDAERARLAGARQALIREAMNEAIKGAPQILFVAAAGNADSDVAFNDNIPSGLDLPNLLAVGAVDQAGAAADFTSFGPTVTLYASGVELEVPIPGGARILSNGTSFAAPQVANLAAKLIAVNPKLGVAEVVALIRNGAQVGDDQRLLLIHPRRTLALAMGG